MKEYISLPFIEVKQPIGTLYNCVIEREDLIKITFTDIRRLESDSEDRDVEIYTGIQRNLSNKRVNEISKYVNTIDATFPNSIILHIQPENIDIKKGFLKIKNEENVAKVLDGQHRIAGLEAFDQNDKEFQTIITIFVGMELEDQALVFATINKTQTKVNKSLVADLFAFAKYRSPQKTAHNIIRALDTKEGSPFEGKIKILGTANDKEKESITQATFSSALIDLYSKDPMIDRDLYKRGKKPKKYEDSELQRKPFRNIFVNEDDALIAQILWNYFYAVRNKWPNAWNEVQPEMILNKSTGFLALMRILRLLYPKFGKIGQVVSKEEFVKEFDKVDILEVKLNKTNYIPGSSGQSKLYQELKENLNL
ncbi:DGQHR domain-containing protein [Flavobacteriaceae bacterium KMM 6898]|nr:DGQHR domain-containing protein [Flavobacteriaceae bacterium KMM 6898]